MQFKTLITAFAFFCGTSTFCQNVGNTNDTLASFHLEHFLDKIALVKADTNFVGASNIWKQGSYRLTAVPSNEISRHVEKWKWKNRVKTGITSKMHCKVKFQDGSKLSFKRYNLKTGVIYFKHRKGDVSQDKQPWWKCKLKLVSHGNNHWALIGKHKDLRKESKVWFSGEISDLSLD